MKRLHVLALLGLTMADTNPMDFARFCSLGECPTDWKNIDGDCFMFAGWEEIRAREVCKENNAEYRDNFLLRENSDSATSHSVSVCVVRRETQCKQVIMISGGLTEGGRSSSVEIYDPSAPPLTRSCQITPNMPAYRYSTVAHGSLVCGGYGGYPRDCIELRDGAWQTAHTLNQNRIGSSSWDSSKGLVIMAGSGASTTTEILRDDLTSDPYFNITETRYDACSITDYDTDTVILTGGRPTWDRVERYGHSGLVSTATLPELNQGRVVHACGSYMKEGKKIYLVVGGLDSSYNYLSSTETWSPGDSSWTTVSPPPRTVAFAEAVTLDNNIFLFGNFDDGGVTSDANKVYKWSGDEEDWTVHGTILERRGFAGVSLVSRSSDVLDRCTT